MGLTLTVLGCSGSYPPPGGACSGYLVQGGGTTVWLDAGSGTLANLQRHVGLHDVDAVVLTHAHADHWTDVLGYHVACRWIHRRRGVPVYAPAEVARLAAEVGGEQAPTLAWTTVASGDQVAVGALALRFERADHGPETLAVRIEGDGATLAYTADTGPAWSMASLGAGADLALCEATFGTADEGTAQHLSARQAGEQATAAGVGSLLLTHLRPSRRPDDARREAATTFSGPVAVATLHERYEIGS